MARSVETLEVPPVEDAPAPPELCSAAVDIDALAKAVRTLLVAVRVLTNFIPHGGHISKMLDEAEALHTTAIAPGNSDRG